MKHPSSRAFFAYWDNKRGAARAPDRADIDPAAVRGLLGDIFVLSCEPNLGFPFRVAGTRVCALAGCDLKDRSFAALFVDASRAEIEEITTVRDVTSRTGALPRCLSMRAAPRSRRSPPSSPTRRWVRSPASRPRAKTAAKPISSCCCCPSTPARTRR